MQILQYPFPIIETYTTIEVTKDTVIQGRLCSEFRFERNDSLSHPPAYFYFGFDSLIYLYEENRRVYLYHSYSQTFNLLYDFNANPGDWWKVKNMCDSINFPNTYKDSLHFVVDSVSYISINGNNLKVMLVKFTGGPTHFWILERIGLVGSPYWEDLGICRGYIAEGVPYQLRCYEDQVIGLYHHLNYATCDTVYTVPWFGIEELGQSELHVYPNPVVDHLNCELNSASLGDIRIRVSDIHGRQVHHVYVVMVDKISFSTADWPAGIYFVELVSEKGGREVVKLVKDVDP